MSYMKVLLSVCEELIEKYEIGRRTIELGPRSMLIDVPYHVRVMYRKSLVRED